MSRMLASHLLGPIFADLTRPAHFANFTGELQSQLHSEHALHFFRKPILGSLIAKN
jgi:hypothetical protein